MKFTIYAYPDKEEATMKIVFEGTIDEVKAQVAEFFGAGLVNTEAAPTPITTANGAKGKAAAKAKAPVDTAAAATAGSPAAPAPAEPAKVMMPLCKGHADIYPNIKAIPAEPSACVKCDEAAKGPKPAATGKAMTMDEIKAIAVSFMDSRKDGPEVFFGMLAELGAESLTGAEGSKALDPARYEDLAKLCMAAMPAATAPAAPARRSL